MVGKCCPHSPCALTVLKTQVTYRHESDGKYRTPTREREGGRERERGGREQEIDRLGHLLDWNTRRLDRQEEKRHQKGRYLRG
jgi:hypothetical protein